MNKNVHSNNKELNDSNASISCQMLSERRSPGLNKFVSGNENQTIRPRRKLFKKEYFPE